MYKTNDLGNLPKRIKKEIQRLSKDTPPGISITVRKDNYRHFDITISGPSNTIYDGEIYKLEMFLRKRYPVKPPKCLFITNINHPNVDKYGRICLDILKDKWTPALTVSRVCLSIQLLLQDPDNANKSNIPTDKGFKIHIKTQFGGNITVFGLHENSTMLDIEKKLEIRHGSSMSKSCLSIEPPNGINNSMWGTPKNMKLKNLGIKPNDTIIWSTIYTKYKSNLSNTVSDKITKPYIPSYKTKISLKKILNKDGKELELFSKLLSNRGWCFISFPKDIQKVIKCVVDKVYNAMKNKNECKNNDDEKQWEQLFDGYGYMYFKDYKHVLRVVTGNVIKQYKHKYPKIIGDDLENISDVMDKLALDITYIMAMNKNIFNSKHINHFNFKCNQKNCNVSLVSGYKQDLNNVKCGLLDFVYYENLTDNKVDKIEYEMIKNKAENVSSHTDPGLFSLSFLSTASGLQLYDIAENCWRIIKNNESVFWCGEAASKINPNILSGIHRVVFNENNARFTSWYECSVDNQLTNAIVQSNK